MFTDIVGYSALAHRDERGALRNVREHDRLAGSFLRSHAGRLVKSTGDGLLAEFPSALDAVHCSLKIQGALRARNTAAKEPIELRIGIHLGEVIPQGTDIMGDAVNIAARVERFADPGGVCVTRPVFDLVRGRVKAPIVPMGAPKLKNIPTPVELYRIILPSSRAEPPLLAGSLPRVVVLPLTNISGRPGDEFFADGMTEELIQTLSRIGGLRVIGRTTSMRYKDAGRSVAEIARELGATAVVEGGIRRTGPRFRITARLLDPASSETLWSDEYDREAGDLFALQSDISRRVTDALEVEILRGERRTIESAPARDPVAHEAYLRGRYHLNQRTEDSLHQAITYFRKALARDPRMARGYAGLADAHSLLAWMEFDRPRDAFPRARAAALRALEIDPGLPEAHASLGFVRFLYDRAWTEAEMEFRKSIALNRSYPASYQYYSDLLKATGRFEAAEQEIRHALELDPLSLGAQTALGHVLYLARRYDDAIAQYRRALELDPGFIQAHLWFGRPYLEKGMFAEAIEELRISVRLSHQSTMSLAVLGHAYASAGRAREARRILRTLRNRSRTEYVPSYWVGLIYVGLADLDSAFDWLARAERERSAWLAWIGVEPRFDRLRTDPRYERLMRRLRLA